MQAHELEGCNFAANISDRANLTVAGQALTALGGADLFGSHGTVFLPSDAAFTDLVTTLGEYACNERLDARDSVVACSWLRLVRNTCIH